MLRERERERDWDEDDEDDEGEDKTYKPPKPPKYKKDTPPSYKNLISTINKIFTNDYYKDYSIDKDPKELDSEGYVFYIRAEVDSTDVVSTIVSTIMKSEVKVVNTRNSDGEDKTVFHISSLSTNVEHGSKSLAILLFIYAISYLKLHRYSYVEYSTLDDCSNRSTKLDGNIYHILGYVPIDETCLKEQECQACSLAGPFDINGHPLDLELELKLSGPEKIADLKVFPQRANDKLNMIIQKNRLNIVRPTRYDDLSDDLRKDGGKKFTRKSHKRKSHKRKSYKRKSHKRKSHKRKSHKRK